ncbi:hypothetical protein LU604_09060 [Erwinia tracheiphila]|uniref:Uncharacterized protein n=1 Tax=Erwinia tracheiphila TaxID=65700 RepID=A0A345CSC0_9GAMM|nr:hypothetical protein [Erwinia tracheiphila]AXF76337.1 hypothetical protein AV903_10230 [Erwinia tracheiphila]UIA85001.1 hypothetical protein LU604_09060 [Erwinia tracheiphila]UIA93598.1 hypothetical protein LU632_09020 [Erwinia tracheiphila]
MRKNKGNYTYFMESSNEGVYHIIKYIKVRSKSKTEGKVKATKAKIAEIYFRENEVDSIDFLKDGLALNDKDVIIDMIGDLKTNVAN